MALRVELLGIRLLGHRNIPMIEVPLNPGVTALIGRNGAGKSRVLAAIEAALEANGTLGITSQILFKVVPGDPDARTSALLPAWRKGNSERLEDGEALNLIREGILSVAYSFAASSEDTPPPPSPPSRDEFDEGLVGDLVFESALNSHRARVQHWVDPVRAAESLAATGWLAWEQRGTSRPFLRAAVDPTTEEPARRFWRELVVNAEGAEIQYEVEKEVEEEFGGETSGEYPFEVFGQEDYWDPDAGSFGSWDPTMPVPVLDLPIQPEPFSGLRVLTDRTTLEEVQSGAVKVLSSVIRRDHMLANWLRESIRPGDPAWTSSDAREMVLVGADSLEDLPEWPPSEVRDLSTFATENLALLLPDAPRLECRVRPMTEWLEAAPATWWALDTPSGDWVPVTALSSSQRRWARLAIAQAQSLAVGLPLLKALGLDPAGALALGQLASFDEPEAGFHRSAELALAQGLVDLAENQRTFIVVATHSPLIASKAHSVVHVSRDERGTVTAETVHGVFDRLDAMGMLHEDRFTWVQAILLVEGHHDEMIVRRLLGETLQQQRVLVLQIGGIRGRDGVVNAEAITQLVERPLVMLVDGLGSQVEDQWKEAQRLARAGDARAARSVCDRIERGHSGYESEFIANAGRRLLDAHRADQFQVVCLSVPDILDLLPASAFLDGGSWEELRKEYADAGRRGESFKEYLSRVHQAQFSNRAITRAIDAYLATADEIPPDLIHLKIVLEESHAD